MRRKTRKESEKEGGMSESRKKIDDSGRVSCHMLHDEVDMIWAGSI